MSLEVNHLTRFYGKQKAVDSISFAVGDGEIVGFLGPNGAGKSTTMKMIAGCLNPSKGHVTINGLNAAKKPLAVKKMVGYLPEQNPLYLDMYVREYLHFVGGIYGMKQPRRKQCMEHVVEQCGLSQEQDKKLGALSKGYRQRVGLAQALIHDPEVLILDEPTSGLDPNQIVEIREMIKTISQNKTVLFSTHIMQEVQLLCNRIIIIHKGKIVTDDRVSTLLSKYKQAEVLLVRFQEKVEKTSLSTLKGVIKVVQLNDCEFQLFAKERLGLKNIVLQFAAANKYTAVTFNENASNMEHVFRALTANYYD